MKLEILPSDYYTKWSDCSRCLKQGSMTIHNYTNQVHLLVARDCLQESVVNSTERYILGLLIQAFLDLQDPVSVDHAYRYSFEAEHLVILSLLLVQ